MHLYFNHHFSYLFEIHYPLENNPLAKLSSEHHNITGHKLPLIVSPEGFMAKVGCFFFGGGGVRE